MLSLLSVGTFYYFDIMSFTKANEAISAKQAFHNNPTSRLGGLASIMALLIGFFLTADQFIFFIVLSSTPVLIAGGFEDLGYSIKPVYRYIAALGVSWAKSS